MLKKDFLRWTLISFLFWSIISILATSFIYFQFSSQYPEDSWWRFFIRQAPLWYFWAILSPLLTALTTILLKAKRPWFLHLFIHGLYSFMIILAYSIGYIYYYEVILNSKLVFRSVEFSARIQQFFFRNFFSVLLIYAFIIAIIYALNWYNQLKETKIQKAVLDKQLLEAQLQTLTHQLQPHFLFNALNAVVGLIRKSENEKAIESIVKISDMLRSNLKNNASNFYTLKEEVHFLRNYLDLEKIRFQENLIIQEDIEEKALSIQIPRLLLQPLVENCIKHGFKNLTEAGIILIQIKDTGNYIQIIVQDNGTGISTESDISNTSGIGLRNTKQRLESVYQERAFFSINAVSPQGTQIIIQIPK